MEIKCLAAPFQENVQIIHFLLKMINKQPNNYVLFSNDYGIVKKPQGAVSLTPENKKQETFTDAGDRTKKIYKIA